jgi:hypothetical protein
MYKRSRRRENYGRDLNEPHGIYPNRSVSRLCRRLVFLSLCVTQWLEIFKFSSQQN